MDAPRVFVDQAARETLSATLTPSTIQGRHPASRGAPVATTMASSVPVPPSNIREQVQTYVQGLTRPVVGGIALDETLTVQWPTGLHALMAFLQPDVLVDRLMVEINRIANTPCPLAEREQWIAEAEAEIDRLQRIEESLVVATGAPREAGCPPWVILGVLRPQKHPASAPHDAPRR